MPSIVCRTGSVAGPQPAEIATAKAPAVANHGVLSGVGKALFSRIE
jgi:hypothetical protein